jgi:hypothetical protein
MSEKLVTREEAEKWATEGYGHGWTKALARSYLAALDALKPFAKLAEAFNPSLGDDYQGTSVVTLRDCRRAREIGGGK